MRVNELLAKGRRLPERLLGVESRLLLWLLAAGLLVLLFLGLASEMAEGETLAWDRAVLLALRQPGDLAMPIGPPWLAKSLKDITALGGGAVLTLVTAIVAGYLLASRRAALAGFLVLSVAGGSIVGTLLKHLFGRDRPDVVPHLVDVQTLSFPSGHAFNSAIVYLTLGALLARTQQRWRSRSTSSAAPSRSPRSSAFRASISGSITRATSSPAGAPAPPGPGSAPPSRAGFSMATNSKARISPPAG